MADDPNTVRMKDTGGSILVLPGIKLTVVEGPDRGREAQARKGTLTVGSAQDNELVLADPAVSRYHCEMRLAQDGVRLRDLDSTNGTRIDGVRVFDAAVAPGARVQLGATVLRVTAIEEPVVVPISPRDRFGALHGQSPAMREVFAVLERVSPTDATVLVEGETGTGKELAAEAVHAHSPRKDGPFVAIDCGAISPSLMESELFGHVRGAFTSAAGDRRGVFEEAGGGTLFLDEIGELPLDLQPKLLRALEKREIRRVGESTARKIDVRVVAATNRDLAAEVNKGAFREDLFFRLAVVRVRLPPLRQRRGDIPLLVHHLVQALAPGTPGPSPELVQAMVAQPWPGNVRELKNALQRALALIGSAATTGRPADGARPAGEGPEALFGTPFKDALEAWTARFERAYLEHALRQSGGSVTGAARLMGVNRRFVHRLLSRHALSASADEPEDDT